MQLAQQCTEADFLASLACLVFMSKYMPRSESTSRLRHTTIIPHARTHARTPDLPATHAGTAPQGGSWQGTHRASFEVTASLNLPKSNWRAADAWNARACTALQHAARTRNAGQHRLSRSASRRCRRWGLSYAPPRTALSRPPLHAPGPSRCLRSSALDEAALHAAAAASGV